ncbi:DJ-1/PfpI family protein [Bacillus paralicheniformis]|uniref:DJ-1/PfpI family protein n=1 Tax=Bacillus paralicheniformis TaxID=1648923 RepID=UPI003D25AB5D
MAKKILIVTGDAVEALEVYYPYYRCLEEGYETTIAAPKKKKIHTVVHDFLDWDTYTEKPGYLIDAHASFDEIDPSEYDGIIIPGGRAPEFIRLYDSLLKIVAHFFEENKPVGAICHASLIFTSLREHLKGRELTAYIACKPEVEAAGATYVEEKLHVDANLVSGHDWSNLPEFMREFFKALNK